MTEQQALEKSIKHWEEMIAWAKEQDKAAEVNEDKMERKICQCWHGNCCSLCSLHRDNCKKCILDYCEDHGWREVALSKTWGEWVINAKKFLEYMRGKRK
jgi:hypothetical protein